MSLDEVTLGVVVNLTLQEDLRCVLGSLLRREHNFRLAVDESRPIPRGRPIGDLVYVDIAVVDK